MIQEIKEFWKSDAGCVLFVVLGGYLGLALGFIYLGPPTIEQSSPACQCECRTKEGEQ